MTKTNKELFRDFITSKFIYYRAEDQKLVRLDYTEISNWKLRLKMFYYEQVLGYKVIELSKDMLDKVLTTRNKGVSMSLKQRFKDKDLKIIKFHKFKNKDLIKYQLYIIGTDNNKSWQGIKANIL